MATTTNYGWNTPDDTDLVKDGAAAIRTLGSSVDTTTKNLNPQTTTGALAYRSATLNVNTALAIGTAGQVLTVNSGATAPEWATPAGSLTSIASGSLSTSALSLTTISGSYKNLILVLSNLTNAAGFEVELRVNADSTSGRYGFILTSTRNDAFLSSASGSSETRFFANPAAFRANENANVVVTFWNYASTTAAKIIDISSIGKDNTNNKLMVATGTAMYNDTSAITGISTVGTYVSGSYILYGVN